MEAGTLNSVGVENARLLKNLMELQKVISDKFIFCHSPVSFFSFIFGMKFMSSELDAHWLCRYLVQHFCASWDGYLIEVYYH